MIYHKISSYLLYRDFFDEVNSFEEFLDKTNTEGRLIEKITKDNFLKVSTEFYQKNKTKIESIAKNRYNKMVGDIFEYFSLCYLNFYSSKYKINSIVNSSMIGEDYGVDAYCDDSTTLQKISIQMKHRSDSSSELSYRELSSFVTASRSGRGDDSLKIKDYSHMILITSCSGLNYRAKREFSCDGVMRVINFNEIKNTVKNDKIFWKYVKDNLSITDNKNVSMDLRDYQEIILKKFSKEITPDTNFRKKFILPTGAGKSIIQAKLIDAAIGNKCKIILSVAPTILLVNQLGNVYEDNILSVCQSFIVSSEGQKDNDGIQKIDNSTNIFDIIENIVMAQTLDIPVILSSTYKSLPNVISAIRKMNCKLDLCILDEGQHSVNSDIFDILYSSIENNIISNMLTFTATPKYHKSSSNEKTLPCMNNSYVYGDNYIIPISDLTEKGFLTKACLSIIESNFNKKDENIISIIDEKTKIINDFLENREVISYSYKELMSIVYSVKCHIKKIRENKNKNMDAKLIISCSSVSKAYLLSMILNEIFKILDYDFCKEDWYIDAISSDSILTKNFSINQDRGNVLSEFKKENINSILCHYNVLSEGIDVPNCTGILILRGMNDILICQTIGRVLRRTKLDYEYHKKIYNTPNYKNILSDSSKWEKLYGYIIIPVFGDSENVSLILDDILTKMFKLSNDFIWGEIEFNTPGEVDIECPISSNIGTIKQIVSEKLNNLKVTMNFKENNHYYFNMRNGIKGTITNNIMRNILKEFL